MMCLLVQPDPRMCVRDSYCLDVCVLCCAYSALCVHSDHRYLSGQLAVNLDGHCDGDSGAWHVRCCASWWCEYHGDVCTDMNGRAAASLPGSSLVLRSPSGVQYLVGRTMRWRCATPCSRCTLLPLTHRPACDITRAVAWKVACSSAWPSPSHLVCAMR